MRQPFPELIAPRLRITIPGKADAVDFFDLRKDETVNFYLDRHKPMSLKEMEDFIDYLNSGNVQRKWFYWTIFLKEGPVFIGTICLWNFSKDKSNAEIGYELKTEFQKKGFMTEAMKAVLDFAFQGLSLKEVRAYTRRDNQNSIRLLQRFRFDKHPGINSDTEEELFFCLQNHFIE